MGMKPEVRTLNTLLLSNARAGEYDKAEEWLSKCEDRALHPELTGLCPTAESYNIMIQMFTRAGQLQRAEKWLEAIEKEIQVRPTLATQLGLIKAGLALHEVRRAHRWAASLIKNGCSQNRNYAPELVKSQRKKFRSSWEWDVAGLVDTIIAVVKALSAAANARTANEWLRYLVMCGMKPEEAPSAWETVRRVHPMEIIPTILSAEQANPTSPGLPPSTKAATLSGEGAKQRRIASKLMSLSLCGGDRPPSSASPRAASPCSMSSLSNHPSPRSVRASLCDSGRRSGAASPSLRKFLDARNRGATPSLAWARNESNGFVLPTSSAPQADCIASEEISLAPVVNSTEPEANTLDTQGNGLEPQADSMANSPIQP